MNTEKHKVDALKFQKQLKEILNKKLEQGKKNINENEYFIDDEKPSEDENGPEKVEDPLNSTSISDEDDQTPEEHKVVVEVQSKAEELNADVLGYQHGVFHIEFDSKDDANVFKDFIEEFDPVDTFEFKSLDESSEESGEGDEDDDDSNAYRFWVYLDPKKVSFDYFDMMYDDDENKESESAEPESESENDEEDDNDLKIRKESFRKYIGKKYFTEDHDKESESEELENPDHEASETPEQEAEEHKKPKTKLHPKKRIKTSCKPGYKYNHETGVCEEVKDDELKSVRKKVRKHLKDKHFANKSDALEKTEDKDVDDTGSESESQESTSSKKAKSDAFED